MYAWYILDTYPLLDKCLANISSQCVACSKFLSGSPSLPSSRPRGFLIISMRVTLNLHQQFWQSFRCSNNLMAISAGHLNLDVSTNELAIFPSKYFSSWAMALFSERRVRSAFPADTWPSSIPRVNSMLSAHPWLAGCLSGFGLDCHFGFVPIFLASDLTQSLAPVSLSALAPDSTRRGAPFQLTCPGQLWGTPDPFCQVSAVPYW